MFTSRCIAGGRAGPPAPFRALTAGRAAWSGEVLALSAGSCWAAACAACASLTAPANKPRMVASCARQRALACSGPFPVRPVMVLWALQPRRQVGVRARTRATGARQTYVDSLGCTWIHRRAASAGPAWLCEGVCLSSMRRRNAPSSVRLRGHAGGSGQGHTATWEHCAYLLAPVGVAKDTVPHSGHKW